MCRELSELSDTVALSDLFDITKPISGEQIWRAMLAGKPFWEIALFTDLQIK